nr:hypothetical protein [Allomuricauda sp.]
MKKALLLLFGLILSTVNAQNKESCNCCSAVQKAFDFWIGDWVVTNQGDGTLAGYSKIRGEEKGCVVKENWTSAKPGYTGTSLNFYNQATKEWEQLWVDNSGAFLKLRGNKEENKMVLSSKEFEREGKTYRNRITWFDNEDGTVRQLWEVLEGDKVVQVAFDGLYKRK